MGYFGFREASAVRRLRLNLFRRLTPQSLTAADGFGGGVLSSFLLLFSLEYRVAWLARNEVLEVAFIFTSLRHGITNESPRMLTPLH